MSVLNSGMWHHIQIRSKFGEIFKNTQKRSKGRTKHLRPNHFGKGPNFHSQATKNPSSQTCGNLTEIPGLSLICQRTVDRAGATFKTFRGRFISACTMMNRRPAVSFFARLRDATFSSTAISCMATTIMREGRKF